jgi:hypothetical protein
MNSRLSSEKMVFGRHGPKYQLFPDIPSAVPTLGWRVRCDGGLPLR